MRALTDYDSEPFIEAITALDWSTDHGRDAVRAIRSIVEIKFGEEFSVDDALWWLGYLLDQRFIQSRIHPDDKPRVGSLAIRRRAKYVRVPPGED